MCGSHNEDSNKLLAQLMAKNGIAIHDGKFWFAQLYGMSDNMGFFNKLGNSFFSSLGSSLGKVSGSISSGGQMSGGFG